MRGKITKLSDNPNAFRTKDMEGTFFHPPTVGQKFQMIGNALELREGSRIFTTSVVQEISTNPDFDGVIIRTENSLYALETYDENR